MTTTELPITWTELAHDYPAFVQWIAQRHGGCPDGNVKQTDYEHFKAEYEEEAPEYGD